MSLIRTFLDAGVLIVAARGNEESSENAMNIIKDPKRELVTSTFIQMEVLPKAHYFKNKQEVKFYEIFFKSVKIWADSLEQIIENAHQHAQVFGLGSMDALHVAAALSVHSEELITTEKSSKPLHRVTGLKVTSIHP